MKNHPHADVDKEHIRCQIKQRRQAMSPSEVRDYSLQICKKLLQLEPLREARVIMGYMSIGHEVDISLMLERFSRPERTLLLPRVEGRHIKAVPFTTLDALQKSAYGILEPVGTAWDPQQIDAVLVPGLAFDYQGYRIGYGKGYYDRFLPRLRKNAFLCGICYEFQVIPFCNPHQQDYPVDWIVTERSELMINESFF